MPVLNLLGVSRTATAGRLKLTHAADVVTEIALGLYDPDLTSLESALADTRSRGWNDELNAPGAGEFIIQNDNADVGLVLTKKLVNMAYRGETAFTMIVETLDRTHIAPGEEADEFTKVSGRGHLALFEKALVYPTLGVGVQPVETDRHINWTSPLYNDAAWIAASEVCTTADATDPVTGWPNVVNNYPPPTFADGFQDGTASVLWASDGTKTTARTGTCWFRQVINPGFGVYKLFFIADNMGQIYIDGQLMIDLTTPLEPRNFAEAHDVIVQLSGGPHVVAFWGYNAPLPPSNIDDPGGVAFTLYGIAASGDLGAFFDHSDTSAKIVEYSDDPPGITVGAAMLQVISELQARGILTTLTATFSGAADSYGEPWPVLSDIVTRVGVDVLSFFTELASSGYIDFWMTPGVFELNAVNAGTRGTV